jgi:hypothetical protein
VVDSRIYAAGGQGLRKLASYKQARTLTELVGAVSQVRDPAAIQVRCKAGRAEEPPLHSTCCEIVGGSIRKLVKK